MHQPKHVVTFKVMGFEESHWVEMAMDQSLSPARLMTALLFAKDFLSQKIEIKDLDLMFDQDNPTNEEEIIQEGIPVVFVRP